VCSFGFRRWTLPKEYLLKQRHGCALYREHHR
jgi:hypothetical protein